MKQQWFFRIFGITLALFCISCTGFFEIEGKEEITPNVDPSRPSSTNIYFDNSVNTFAVDVFSSSTRDTASRIAAVPAGGQSPERSWISSEAMNIPTCEFYLTYYVAIPGLSKGIPYKPFKYAADSISTPVPANTTTRIAIHNLRALVDAAGDNDAPLFENEVWLVIKNEFPSAVQLMRGVSPVSSIDNETYIVNSGSAVYTIPANTTTSLFKIKAGITEKELPITTPALQAGYLYQVTYTAASVPVLSSEKLLTLGNL